MKATKVYPVRRWHRQCNWYCRGERHAEVAWYKSGPLTLQEVLSMSLAHYGAVLVEHFPAPEAVYPTRPSTYLAEDGKYHPNHGKPQGDLEAYMAVFTLMEGVNLE